MTISPGFATIKAKDKEAKTKAMTAPRDCTKQKAWRRVSIGSVEGVGLKGEGPLYPVLHTVPWLGFRSQGSSDRDVCGECRL